MNTLALGPSWLDPDYLIGQFGLIGVLVVIFAESGLLIGFFLPGDSLLFTTGLLVSTGKVSTPLWFVCILVALAAVLGDQVGYLFGRKVGPALFKRPDSRLFKQENIEKAHDFFEKYGPKSLVLARFVPVVRTFTPIVAGVSRMNYRLFITYNVIGGVLWGVGVTLLGAGLGKIDFVHKHIELMLVLIVLFSVVPIAIEFLRARSTSKKEAALAEEERDTFGGDDPSSGTGTDPFGPGPSDGGPYGGPGAGAYNGGPARGPYGGPVAGPYGGPAGGRGSGPQAGPRRDPRQPGPYGGPAGAPAAQPGPSYGPRPGRGAGPYNGPARGPQQPGPYGGPQPGQGAGQNAGPYNGPARGPQQPGPYGGPSGTPGAGRPQAGPPPRDPRLQPYAGPAGAPGAGTQPRPYGGPDTGPGEGPDAGPDGTPGRGRHARR